MELNPGGSRLLRAQVRPVPLKSRMLLQVETHMVYYHPSIRAI